MIKVLYETHLFVENLERSIDFYKNVLGLTECGYNDERRIAFFWIGEPKGAMLGLWEKPKDQIDIRHFAFSCDLDFVLHKAAAFLKSKNLKPYNFLKDGSEQPMVFAWMPALAIYFKDPDGHDLLVNSNEDLLGEMVIIESMIYGYTILAEARYL